MHCAFISSRIRRDTGRIFFFFFFFFEFRHFRPIFASRTHCRTDYTRRIDSRNGGAFARIRITRMRIAVAVTSARQPLPSSPHLHPVPSSRPSCIIDNVQCSLLDFQRSLRIQRESMLRQRCNPDRRRDVSCSQRDAAVVRKVKFDFNEF